VAEKEEDQYTESEVERAVDRLMQKARPRSKVTGAHVVEVLRILRG
jgi:hypothetical protein